MARYFKIWVTESIKLKEIDKTHKDKENILLFQKYFDFIIVFKKAQLKDSIQLCCKRLVYHKDAIDNSPILEFFDYLDPFMKFVIETINASLSK